MQERLDKFLADQALLTRSEARKAVTSGCVTVNGDRVKQANMKIDPIKDYVMLNGSRVEYTEFVYIMLNKPKGVLSAAADKSRKTVVDLVPKELFKKEIFPVGRLDRDTTGFIIITNDGDFAHRVISPKSDIKKVYEVTLDKPVTEDTVLLFESGVTLDDGTKCLPAKLAYSKTNPTFATVTINEGKYHQIKRMFGTAGLGVEKLHRKSIGGILLDNKLKSGDCRLLTSDEISAICKGNNKI